MLFRKTIFIVGGILITALIFFKNNSFATAQWIWIPQPVQINHIRSYGEGNTGHFVFINNTDYWEGCSNTQQSGIYYLPPNSGDAFSLLTLARITGQTVSLQIQGYENCFTGYAVIKEVEF